MIEEIQNIIDSLSDEWKDKDLTFTFYIIVNSVGQNYSDRSWCIGNALCMIKNGKFRIPISYKEPFSKTPFGYRHRIEIKESPDTTWLIIIRKGNHNTVDPLEQKIIRGLLYVLAGRNIAYEKYSTFQVSNDGKYSFATESFLNPNAFPAVNISALEKQLTEIEIITRNHKISKPVENALKWYLEAIESSGIDAIIKLWVAFEAIAMKTTNINSSFPLLSSAYELNEGEVKDKFLIGKIHGYRSDLLHGIKDRKFDIILLRYLELLVSDLIIFRTTSYRRKKAYNFLKNNQTEIEKTLQI